MIAHLAPGHRRIAALILCVAIAGCAGRPVATPQAAASTPARPPTVAQQAAAIALDQVGAPYRYGGSSPHGFDCSGLVYYSYRRAGKAIPRTTSQLWNSTEAVARDDIHVGDLLFFRIDGKMQHVGLYVGGGRFVHAPSSGRQVSVASLRSEYYRAAFIRAGRPR